MDFEKMIETLQAMEFFQGLELHQLAVLASIVKEVSFGEGDMVFREGDIGQTLYLIQEGQVAVEVYLPGQGPVTILTVGPGQLLGWSSLFATQRKTASGRVVKPTKALALEADELLQMCQTDHELGCKLAWRIAELIAGRLKATRLQLLDIFAPPEPVR
jgi:CRP-like cAMP-binding protein